MCEKCRLMELFDEELARFESYDNGEAFSIARHRYALERRGISEGRAMVIAHSEPFQEQPDPLAEWKALEPGRKVLNKISKRVWSIVSFSERGNCYQLVDPENKEVGTSLGSSHEDFENNYQILHEGPFDAGKLKVGDWVWNIPLDKWVTFEGYADQCNIVPIFKDPETGNRYCYDYLSRYTHSFSPPAPPSREERIEKATEKIWHLIDRAANQSTVAKEEARAILIELMEEKP